LCEIDFRLSTILVANRAIDEALALLREALARSRAVMHSHPTPIWPVIEAAVSLEKIGFAETAAHRPREALAAFEEQCATLVELVKRDPQRFSADLAEAHLH